MKDMSPIKELYEFMGRHPLETMFLGGIAVGIVLMCCLLALADTFGWPLK